MTNQQVHHIISKEMIFHCDASCIMAEVHVVIKIFAVNYVLRGVFSHKSLRPSNQMQIHTGSHRFTKIGQIFHNKHFFNTNKSSKLKSHTFLTREEWN